MTYNLFSFVNTTKNFFEQCDAPRPWGIYFQDSASPQMEALVELHDNIMFYLVIILFAVGWVLTAIVVKFISTKSGISNKYVSHGTYVPIQKCFKFNSKRYLSNSNNLCFYSTKRFLNTDNTSFKENAYTMRESIIKDNMHKSGIYIWTNKLTNDIYIGQSINLGKRFLNYFNLSYLRNKKSLVISRALIKYGYYNFTLEILQYCDIPLLTEKEQYYINKLSPKYNTLKIAGSSSGHRVSEETKAKISNSLKGIYVNEKSALYGRTASQESKTIMSLKKLQDNNPLFAKTHSVETKELMREKALGRKHSEETLLKMSISRGHTVYISEKCDEKGFKLIGSFVSIRRAAKFLDISANTIKLYINSKQIFKNRYKFSSSETSV